MRKSRVLHAFLGSYHFTALALQWSCFFDGSLSSQLYFNFILTLHQTYATILLGPSLILNSIHTTYKCQSVRAVKCMP